MNFEQLLKFGVDQGASGIHLQAASTPQLRIGGLVRSVEGAPVKAEELRAFITSIAQSRRMTPQSIGCSPSVRSSRLRWPPVGFAAQPSVRSAALDSCYGWSPPRSAASKS